METPKAFLPSDSQPKLTKANVSSTTVELKDTLKKLVRTVIAAVVTVTTSIARMFGMTNRQKPLQTVPAIKTVTTKKVDPTINCTKLTYTTPYPVIFTPREHVIRAFEEFIKLTIVELGISYETCAKIMQAYSQRNIKLLEEKLDEAEASIYNNNTSRVVVGNESPFQHSHMAAYSATCGFVFLNEESTIKNNRPKFKTPPNDPIVVVAKCTRIMLNGKILEMARTTAQTIYYNVVPEFTWINGVPGCGKTTWIVDHFYPQTDVIITTTIEAAKDVKERLRARIGDKAKGKVRTMASVLVNGLKDHERLTCRRLLIDEALMNHFGAIIMASWIAGVRETVMVGDKNQLPFIDRAKVFELQYCRPDHVAKIKTELVCTRRNPCDVAFALSEVYDGIFSSSHRTRSLELKKFTGAHIRKDSKGTLYLTHTQREKQDLKSMGYGTGPGSRVNTIHEAQGLTFDTVVVVRTKRNKIQLHDSVPHAIVAVSRHRLSCTYYSDDSSDAISRFILKAANAKDVDILKYNLSVMLARLGLN